MAPRSAVSVMLTGLLSLAASHSAQASVSRALRGTGAFSTAGSASTYKIIESGTCADIGMAPLHDVALCEEAAARLFLSDTTLQVTKQGAYPKGCFVYAPMQHLWMGVGTANQTVEASETRPMICGVDAGATYVRIAGGTCDDLGMEDVYEESVCEHAAKQLGLWNNDSSVDALLSTDSSSYPDGCFWFSPGTKLYMGMAMPGQGAEPTRYLQKICSPQGGVAGAGHAPPPGGPFLRIAQGTCAQHGYAPIHDVGMCEAAASELGLPDASIWVTNRSDRPHGCFWYEPASTLWIGTDVGNQHVQATIDRQIICGQTSATAYYVRIAGGTCADINMHPIHKLDSCQAATTDLGLESSTLPSVSFLSFRPEGCSWFSSTSRLFMARHPGSLGKAADYYQHSICGHVEEFFEAPALQYTFYFGKKLPKGEDDGVFLDAGAGYGPKQGGLKYGWSCGDDVDVDMQKGRRGRKRAGGLGLNLFDKNNTCCDGKNAKGKCRGDSVSWKPVNWELQLPAGVYDVEVTFPEEDTSECQVEGEFACQATTVLEGADESCTYRKQVTVTDGRLTVTGYSFKSEKCTSLAKVMVASAR